MNTIENQQQEFHIGLTDKEIKDSELVTLHRDLLNNYLNTQTSFSIKKKKQILKLYDSEVKVENIRSFYNRHIKIFLVGLVTNNLDRIKKYVHGNK